MFIDMIIITAFMPVRNKGMTLLIKHDKTWALEKNTPIQTEVTDRGNGGYQVILAFLSVQQEKTKIKKNKSSANATR